MRSRTCSWTKRTAAGSGVGFAPNSGSTRATAFSNTYDLQHVRADEGFFRERQWYELEACLERVVRELSDKYRVKRELWAAVKAYNGSGARAEEYMQNVRAFTGWARDEIGRGRAPVAPSPPPAERRRGGGGRAAAGRS